MVAGSKFAFGTQTCGDHIKDRTLGILGYRLLQLGDFDPGGALEIASVGNHLATDNFQQCGFAGAIATNKADPLAGSIARLIWSIRGG